MNSERYRDWRLRSNLILEGLHPQGGVSYLRSMVAIGVGVLGVLMAFEGVGLRINLGASMPRGLYRLFPCGEAAHAVLASGDLVAVDSRVAASSNPKFSFFEERAYLTFTGRPDDLLLKEVAALGPRSVEDREGILDIEGRPLSWRASRRLVSARGEVLPEVVFPYRLQAGDVWLSSEHPSGIDSRYFGGVSRHAIACKAEALWTL